MSTVPVDDVEREGATAGGAVAPGGPPGSGRGRHRARWIAGAVLVAGAALAVVLATRPQAQVEEAQSQLLGQQAPPITGTDIASGRPVSLAALHGRWVVVNFFASWCGPCQQETPELVAFAYQHRAPGGVALVGVVINDTVAAARSWDATVGVTWPVVGDPGGQIALAYGAHGQPETFVLDPSGRIVVYVPGPVTSSGLDAWIAKAQAQEAASGA